MEFFQSEKVAANVTKISDLSGVFAYLVEGSEKAAIIDTCCGVGDLKAYTASLTQKPVTVICTHGHIDHAGGTYGFDEVYLNEKDDELVKIHTTVEFRKRGFENNEVVKLEDFVPQREGGYQNLSDGQVFDLGGTTLEAIAFPGHTQGMTCVLFRELRTLLLGDGCNPFTFLFLPESSSVEQYKHNLQSLLRHADRYDAVWFSHGQNQGPKTIVNTCIELCDEIMAGKTDNVPFNFMGQTAIIAKAMTPEFSRVDGKLGNIVFNPERIFNR